MSHVRRSRTSTSFRPLVGAGANSSENHKILLPANSGQDGRQARNLNEASQRRLSCDIGQLHIPTPEHRAAMGEQEILNLGTSARQPLSVVGVRTFGFL